MHQTKKKKLVLVLWLAFFAVAGVWYYMAHGRHGTEQASELTPEQMSAHTPEQEIPDVPISPKPEQTYCYVFLCGSVVMEGVYRLPEGSRLYEAVELAGGFTEEADEAYHNLARVVVDGERVYIPSVAETEAASIEEKLAGSEPEQSAGMATSNDTTGSGKVNLNTATREELMTLTGIGAAKADDILEYRTKVGNFGTIEELMNVSGIGTAMFEKIKEKITVQ